MDVLGFVGHSFDPKDYIICRKICDYLDSLTEIHPHFSFERARSAAPIEIATKVREILDRKNLFIGICTKHQMSSKNFFKKIFNYYLVKSTDIIWKCSDWIMQEAAYSLGQGKKIILLVEEGVANPTIFGINLEYIPFNRNKPEDCFKPLLEMITKLLPQLKPVEDANLVVRNDSEEPKNTLMPNKPNEQWNIDDYSMALIYNAIFLKDKDEIDKLVSQFKEKFSNEEYELFLAESLHFKILYLNEDHLNELHELHNKYPDSNNISSYLAEIYASFENKEKVLFYLNKITESPGLDPLERFSAQCDFVIKEFEYQQPNAKRNMEKLLSLYNSNFFNNEHAKTKILNCLKSVFKITGDKNNLAAFSELYLTLHPLNYDERFNLALSYSSWEIPSLSLLHNRFLKKNGKTDAAVLNNKGVDQAKLGLKARSIKSYQQAGQLKETLALRNLASNFVNDGYLTEAKKICDSVIQMESHDRKIHELYSQIESVKEKEKTLEEDAIRKAEKRQKFYCKYAESYLSNNIFDLNGKWENNEMQLEISSDNKEFTAIGQYKQISGNALTTLLNSFNEGKIIEITGKISGLSGQYKKNIRLSPQPRTLLGEINDNFEGILILNNKEDTIEVFETPDNMSNNYYTLRRVKRPELIK